jgi:hypothetical protein
MFAESGASVYPRHDSFAFCCVRERNPGRRCDDEHARVKPTDTGAYMLHKRPRPARATRLEVPKKLPLVNCSI